MKKLFIILAAALAALAFSSCEKSEAEPTGSTVIKVNISVANPGEAETKAVKTGWTTGDKINIWFDANKATTPDLVLTYDGTEWVNGSLREGVTLSASGKFKALYEGLNNLSAYTAQDYSAGACFSRTNNAIPLVLYTEGDDKRPDYTYNSSTGVLSGSITEWYTRTRFQVVVNGLDAAAADNYQLKCDKMLAHSSFDVYKTSCTGGNTSYDYYMGGVSNTDGVAFSFLNVKNSGMSDTYTFTLYDNDSGAAKKYTVAGRTLTSGNKVQSIKLNSSSFTIDGFVKDGLVYSVSGTDATLEKRDYYGGSGSYKGSITIPATVSFGGTEYTVTTIGSSAFKKCTSLTSVTIPEGIKYIDAYAFEKTGLTTLNLPASLEYINEVNSVFNDNSSLSSVTVPSGNTHFLVENDILYYKKTSTSYEVMFVPESKTGDIVLNANTTSIASNGTLYNTQASSIEFPAGFNVQTWGQFRGTITDGLELKFNYATAAAFTTVFGSSMNNYDFGQSNCTKIVASFPSTLPDADLTTLTTWFGSDIKKVKKRS